ncbi:hypothetical protein [Pseudomonas syringae]|uniref:hypothetical protein n=1 Tax=Pseudomonas syringae TaxID=317 RepID=UPI003F74E114
MDTSQIQQLLPQLVEAVERAGVLLARECVRPGDRRGCGDKAEIDVKIEVLLRADLLSLLDCDWWARKPAMFFPDILSAGSWIRMMAPVIF